MAYYRAGDYYRGGGYYRAGGLLSSIGGALKKVGSVARLIPGVGGVIGTVATAVGGAMSPTRAPSFAATPVTLAAGPGRPVPGVGGAISRFLPGGETGYIKSRRMNAGNAKAARRAIRRIKAVRHLLQGIEREMPHKHCTRAHAKHR